jgi:hypothetical protein
MVALILAGALGNIIDSTFYGVIYKYAGLFHGRVVDMFYFPLLTGNFPHGCRYGVAKNTFFSARYLTWPMLLYQLVLL